MTPNQKSIEEEIGEFEDEFWDKPNGKFYSAYSIDVMLDFLRAALTRQREAGKSLLRPIFEDSECQKLVDEAFTEGAEFLLNDFINFIEPRVTASAKNKDGTTLWYVKFIKEDLMGLRQHLKERKEKTNGK